MPQKIATRSPFSWITALAVLLAWTQNASSGLAVQHRPAAAETGAFRTAVPLGVNIEGLADWMHTPMFVDAMKTARPFGPPDTPWTGGIPTDSQGWPLRDFGSCIITGLPHMGGRYSLLFTGKADVAPVACAASVVNQTYDSRTNRTTADVVVPADSTQLMLSFKNTDGGLKDIRLIRPGYLPNTRQLFTDSFLNAIKPYSALRLMDYLASNGTPVVHWSDRTQEGDALYDTGKGGPWEPMIALANASGKDLWINIPYQADDDYVRRLAILFKTELMPGRKIYLEYSNEVWNSSFPQAAYNIGQAAAESLDPHSVLKVRVSADDDPSNAVYCAWKRIPERLLQITRIWRDTYGEPRYGVTVRPVLASQLGWTFILQEQLAFIQTVYGPPAQQIYGVAGAPYFNMMGEEGKTGLTTDEVLEDLGKSVDFYASHGLEPYSLMSEQYGVKLMGYEGGVDVGQGEQSLDAKAAAQIDPRMKPLLARYLDSWYANGGSLFMYFTLCGGWSKWGFWGLTDDLDRTTPKTEAVAELLSGPPPAVTAGIPVPGTITGESYYLGRWGNYAPAGSTLGQIGKDDFRLYLLNAATPGTYRITVDCPGSEGRLQMALDTGKTIPSAPSGTVTLPGVSAGLHALRLSSAGGSVTIRGISIEKAPN